MTGRDFHGNFLGNPALGLNTSECYTWFLTTIEFAVMDSVLEKLQVPRMIKMSLYPRECALQKTSPEQALDAKPAPTSGDRSSARRVALVGFCTVGRAVAKILCERTDGVLPLTNICNRNFERKKQPWGPGDA